MPLVKGPSGGLLQAPSGLLAGSTDCCCGTCECCEEVECESETFFLPECGPVNPHIGFTVDINVTACQNVCIACGSPDEARALGTSSALTRTGKKLRCTSNVGTPIVIPDPANLCLSLERCREWQSCDAGSDTYAIQIAVYNAFEYDCSHPLNRTVYTTASITVNLAYDGVGKQFVLCIFLSAVGAGGLGSGMLFYGRHAFDATSLSAYSAFPLTFTNEISACDCLCSDPDYQILPLLGFGTGGTVTLNLYDACEEECPSGFMAMMESGPAILTDNALAEMARLDAIDAECEGCAEKRAKRERARGIV